MNLTASQAPNTNPSTLRVRAAFAALREMLPDYYAHMYTQRAGMDPNGLPNPDAVGSIYPEYPVNKLQGAIEEFATWEPYTHPTVAPGAAAFAAKVPGGQLGLVELATLDPETPLRLLDPKATGMVEAVVEGVRGAATNLTVAILGDHEGREVCFTFFPGEPIRPSQVTAAGRVGTTIPARDALALGLTIAKIG